MTDPLRDGVAAVVLPRDVLGVRGPDAVSFLQGQLAQDVAGLGVGSSADSLLLQPSGKVDALLRVTRTGDEEVLVDVDGGAGEAVAARLARFKLRVRADIEPLPWRCIALRGPRAHDVEVAGLALAADWPGLPGVDLLGPDPVVPPGVAVVDVDAWEAARIEAGVPRMGRELDESVIPAEAGIVERAVSFTKGCFTGQELVARIDSRGGNVPRRLRGLVVAGGEVPPPGAGVSVGEQQVGRVTSAARSPRLGVVALAYVRRAVEPPAAATVTWDTARADAEVRVLPLA